ncbi:SRPBCC domain-containing protein [Jeotgalibaca sp. A127]|uniref:SRPBCC domain-containing protein n=1 Tax=Jeotgalibaca sp. A127 TaxID=3457324 RepID=UPI003FD02D25
MENKTHGRVDTVSKVIAAAPHILYEAYMNPNALVQWLPPEGMTGEICRFEPHVGGRYELTLTYNEKDTNAGKTTADTDTICGTFLELIPNQKIAEAGIFDSEDASFAGEMIMIWYFEEVLEGTKVSIIAENVPEGIRKSDHIDGLSSTLENLASFVETR